MKLKKGISAQLGGWLCPSLDHMDIHGPCRSVTERIVIEVS